MRVLNYRVLLQKEPEGGYTVIVPILPGCVTYGKTIKEAKLMAKEAIELYIESLKDHNEEIPIEEEPLLNIIGLGRSGLHDVSENHDKYLAESKLK
jgi:antitoxin HicB